MLREISKRSGLSRNALRRRLRQQDVTEPAYPTWVSPSTLDPYHEQLVAWLRTDSHRPQRDRRTARVLFHAPGLRDRIDPAFAALARTRRPAIVVIAAQVPLPVPSAASTFLNDPQP